MEQLVDLGIVVADALTGEPQREPDPEQALAATGRLDRKLTGANPVHVMIQWPGRGLYDPATLAVIGEAHRVLCSCMHGRTMEAGDVARRVRDIMSPSLRAFPLALGVVGFAVTVPILVQLLR